jgi:hypothetical protein
MTPTLTAEYSPQHFSLVLASLLRCHPCVHVSHAGCRTVMAEWCTRWQQQCRHPAPVLPLLQQLLP